MPTEQDCTCIPAVITSTYRLGNRTITDHRHERRKVTDCPIHGQDDDAIERTAYADPTPPEAA